MEWLLEEINQTGNIIKSYTNEVSVSSAIAITELLISMMAASIIRSHVEPIVNQHWLKVLAIGTPLMLVGWNILLLLINANNHPQETSVLAYSLAVGVKPEIKGGAITMQPSNSSMFNKVVLIVDESIRYDFFESLLSAESKRLNAINFGEAIAFSPCTASSHAMLRWGFSKDRQLLANADPRTNPKIWKYAKAAGFTTHLWDGQSSGKPQNWVSKNERLDIDEFQALENGIDTDKVIAKKINLLLQSNSRDFAYIVKRGVHFRYEQNYPKNMQSNVKTRSQSYIAAIKYSTSGFLTSTLEEIDMKKVIVIYTSDHGQRLDGSGASHCNAITHRTEYSVPLLAFTDNLQWRNELYQASNIYQNKTTHLQIFPTLLIAFGYDKHQVVDRYFPTLFDPLSSRPILEYPFTPFPNLRNNTPPIKMVTGFLELGLPDDKNDPPVD